MTMANTATAAETITRPLIHPWPCDNRPNISLQDLSASFSNVTLALSSVSANAFSFYIDIYQRDAPGQVV